MRYFKWNDGVRDQVLLLPPSPSSGCSHSLGSWTTPASAGLRLISPQHFNSLIHDISSLGPLFVVSSNMKKVLLGFDERRPPGRVQVRRLQDRQVQV